jgi:hypothetical protein
MGGGAVSRKAATPDREEGMASGEASAKSSRLIALGEFVADEVIFRHFWSR